MATIKKIIVVVISVLLHSTAAETWKFCKTSTVGWNFKGDLTTTQSGRTCQAWAAQSPHKHSKGTEGQTFPDGSIEAAGNKCRNPDNSANGPWCYTTDPAVRWDFCDVPLCSPVLCKTSTAGWEYRGDLTTTKSGYTCKPWEPQSLDKNGWTITDSMFPDGSINAAANKCRSPDKYKEGPWCFTTNPAKLWELCDVPMCSS